MVDNHSRNQRNDRTLSVSNKYTYGITEMVEGSVIVIYHILTISQVTLITFIYILFRKDFFYSSEQTQPGSLDLRQV